MIRMLLIVALTAIFGALLSVISLVVLAAVQVQNPQTLLETSELQTAVFLMLPVLIFTLPGATFLLGVQFAIGSSNKYAKVLLLAAGSLAGALIALLATGMPPYWETIGLFAWCGLCTSSVFAALSSAYKIRSHVEQ